MSGTDSSGKEPKGGGAEKHPKNAKPAKGYGQNFKRRGPGRKPGGETTGKGGKHTRT